MGQSIKESFCFTLTKLLQSRNWSLASPPGSIFQTKESRFTVIISMTGLTLLLSPNWETSANSWKQPNRNELYVKNHKVMECYCKEKPSIQVLFFLSLLRHLNDSRSTHFETGSHLFSHYHIFDTKMALLRKLCLILSFATTNSWVPALIRVSPL